jgi:hypothetical protein
MSSVGFLFFESNVLVARTLDSARYQSRTFGPYKIIVPESLVRDRGSNPSMDILIPPCDLLVANGSPASSLIRSRFDHPQLSESHG